MNRKSRIFDPLETIHLLRKMNKIPTWNKEKISLKEQVLKNMRKSKHVVFVGGYDYWYHSKVGEYSEMGLPKDQRGHLKSLAGRNVLFVCVGSGPRWKRTYMATALPLK